VEGLGKRAALMGEAFDVEEEKEAAVVYHKFIRCAV